MSKRRTALAALALLALVFAFGGCGGGDDDEPTLVFLGAASLQEAGTKYAESFEGADVKTSFAGSDELAAQIRQGAEADVFASADTEFPKALQAEGLAYAPTVFAGNRLVVVTQPDGSVKSLDDLAKLETDIVIGAPSVPVGAYTRTFLGRLPASQQKAILANVRSEEPDVTSVLAKVEQGAADAGFVYATDARTAPKLHVLRFPERLQPEVAYAAVVLKTTKDKQLADRFLDGLVNGAGAEYLQQAGFLPPP